MSLDVTQKASVLKCLQTPFKLGIVKTCIVYLP